MKKQNLALALGAAMMVAGVAPAFADGFVSGENSTPIGIVAGTSTMEDGAVVSVDADKNSLEEVEYQEIENEVGTQSATVYAKVGSTFTVTIPKVIVLKGMRGEASTATYKVDVDGDIAGNEYVLVQPDTTFAMKQAGKADVDATVAQELIKYRAYNYTADLANGEAKIAAAEDAIADGEGTGTVSATLTAGKWQGTFDFDIQLMDDEGNVSENAPVDDASTGSTENNG